MHIDSLTALAYQAAMWFAVFVPLALVITIYLRPGVNARIPFVCMMFSILFWALTNALVPLLPALSQKTAVLLAGFVISNTLPMLWFLFAFRFANAHKRFSGGILAVAAVVPVAALLLVATQPWFHLIRGAESVFRTAAGDLVEPTSGPAVLCVALGAYLLILGGAVILIRSAMRMGQRFRIHAVVLSFAALFPMVVDIISSAGLFPWFPVEVTPLTLAVSGVLLAWSIVRLGLFAVLPVAYKTLFHGLADGGVVIDENGCIAEVNTSAKSIFGERHCQPGAETTKLDAALPGIGRLLNGAVLSPFEVGLPGSPVRWFEAVLTPLRDDQGKAVGQLLTLHDITEFRNAECERERLITELKTTLESVKTLSGLLPICASCKKIRDDKGYWENVEGYVTRHTDAKFSHGICPDCLKHLYPDAYAKLHPENPC